MNISFRNVSFAYELFGEHAQAQPYQLRGITFAVAAAEFIAIAGRSGSGKTTLMQMFNGLLRPTSGQVLVEDADIHARGYDLSRLRTRLGLAFQFPEAQLFGATVQEDIAFGPSQQKLPQSEIHARTLASLQLTGLPGDFLQRNPLTLSEGEKRRVALAGIFAMNPEMLVLDEPTASLDAAGVNEIKRILRQWHRRGKTVVLVSHDMDLVAELAERMLVLHDGEIIFDGAPAALWVDGETNANAPPPELLAQAGLAVPRAMRLRRWLKGKKIPIKLEETDLLKGK